VASVLKEAARALLNRRLPPIGQHYIGQRILLIPELPVNSAISRPRSLQQLHPAF
jgi:hypothetical protein